MEINTSSTNSPASPLPKRKRRAVAGWDPKRGAFRVRNVWTSGWRLGVQALFTLISLAMGWQFYRFVDAAMTTRVGALPARPPGVEGYLPISGLMGALDWIYQGALNAIHPAATILFMIFVLTSLVVRKAFCGWICPVGFISDWLARLGQILFKKNFRLPGWVDIPLRSLKHLLLGFFVWAIFVAMTPEALNEFIQSPYNKVSDVKMMMFFVKLGAVGGIVLGVLAALSVLIQGFWCRYLCPYGALLGLFSWASPVKVRRDPVTCTDCGLCDKACPARLPVMAKLEIKSPECLGCADCVASCPVPTALWMGTRERKISSGRIALLVVVFFAVGYIAARVGGVWESDLTDEEYRYHIERMEGPEYGHPGR